MLIWMLSTFFFTLSGIRHGTGRGLTYFVLVYVLSYLFSLAAAAFLLMFSCCPVSEAVSWYLVLFTRHISILRGGNYYLYFAENFEVKHSSY